MDRNERYLLDSLACSMQNVKRREGLEAENQRRQARSDDSDWYLSSACHQYATEEDRAIWEANRPSY